MQTALARTARLAVTAFGIAAIVSAVAASE